MKLSQEYLDKIKPSCTLAIVKHISGLRDDLSVFFNLHDDLKTDRAKKFYEDLGNLRNQIVKDFQKRPGRYYYKKEQK